MGNTCNYFPNPLTLLAMTSILSICDAFWTSFVRIWSLWRTKRLVVPHTSLSVLISLDFETWLVWNVSSCLRFCARTDQAELLSLWACRVYESKEAEKYRGSSVKIEVQVFSTVSVFWRTEQFVVGELLEGCMVLQVQTLLRRQSPARRSRWSFVHSGWPESTWAPGAHRGPDTPEGKHIR